MGRILVAEDDVKLARTVALYLESDGHTVLSASSGQEAVQQFKTLEPDVVLLDVMLPGLDGFDACRLMRAHAPTPILMLTARTDEDDLIAGLASGADDYITKPFSPRELLARVRAALRRVEDGGAPTTVTIGELEIDHDRHRATLGGAEVTLTPKEFAIAWCLASGNGRAMSRQQLMREAFGDDSQVYDRSVDVHVANLRRKLGDDADDPRYVETVFGVGYRMREPTR